MTKTELDKIASAIKKKEGRERKSTQLYLSERIFKEFKRLCEDRGVSASKVIEEFMRGALDKK